MFEFVYRVSLKCTTRIEVFLMSRLCGLFRNLHSLPLLPLCPLKWKFQNNTEMEPLTPEIPWPRYVVFKQLPIAITVTCTAVLCPTLPCTPPLVLSVPLFPFLFWKLACFRSSFRPSRLQTESGAPFRQLFLRILRLSVWCWHHSASLMKGPRKESGLISGTF